MNWLVLNSLFRENKNREIIPYEKISKIKTKQKFWLSKLWKFLHATFSTFKVFENEFLLSRKWLEEFSEVLVLRESTWCTNVGGHGPLASPVSLTLDFFSKFEHMGNFFSITVSKGTKIWEWWGWIVMCCDALMKLQRHIQHPVKNLW